MTTVSPLEDRTWEDAPTAGPRPLCAPPRRELHGLLLVEIYVKGGIVTRNPADDYPRTRWDMPNHEPRGCAQQRQLQLVPLQRQSGEMPVWCAGVHSSAGVLRQGEQDTVDAWATHPSERPQGQRDYQQVRGAGWLRAVVGTRVNQLISPNNQRLHHQAARPRSRLLADPGHEAWPTTPRACATCH